MICPGIVTNVTNFGAFVDIGVHQDGLVHISQLSDKFIKEPREVVNPGDRVQVKILEVNLGKNQISLSMKAAAPVSRPAREPREERGARPGGGASRGLNRGAPSSGASREARAPGPRVAPNNGGGPKSGGKPQQHGSGSKSGSGSGPRPSKPQPAFNNPFGALASLKGSLKTQK
jgi:uncharacterized protein